MFNDLDGNTIQMKLNLNVENEDSDTTVFSLICDGFTQCDVLDTEQIIQEVLMCIIIHAVVSCMVKH